VTLAHTATSGPHLEYLLVGAALAVLGIVFFAQRSVKPMVSIVLVLGGLVLGAGAFVFTGEEAATTSDVSIRIVSPEAGATLPAGEPVEIQVAIDGGTLTTDMHSEEGEGHLHLVVNGRTVSMPVSETFEAELEPGPNDIEVEFTQPNQASFDPPITARINVTAES
jgi:hypothetical protein